jgi:hypothetical protein
MARGCHLGVEHWEAHLWHIVCGVWAERRCRVCALKETAKGIPAQWELEPGGVRLWANSDIL